MIHVQMRLGYNMNLMDLQIIDTIISSIANRLDLYNL